MCTVCAAHACGSRHCTPTRPRARKPHARTKEGKGGGVRRGSDIVKAMALGANACIVGRAGLYGLAAGGQAGVAQAISILQQEIDITQALLGLPDLSQVSPRVIF